ncbi:hypothetical protein P692DRAFT_20689955, partial [Suillus brevipes Sb2]
AAWRILGFEITRKEPSVENLPVHLPGKNTPQFHRAGPRSTGSLLDHYFLRPHHLNHLRYEEYYEQYILYPFKPPHLLREHEYMELEKRALLIHKPASSFIDLRTVNEHVFATFHEAASDLGLFENNQEGFLALQEAVDCLRTPSQLRFLFAQIILEDYPATILWDQFKEQLSIDHVLREGDQQNGYRCTLHKIDDILS